MASGPPHSENRKDCGKKVDETTWIPNILEFGNGHVLKWLGMARANASEAFFEIRSVLLRSESKSRGKISFPISFPVPKDAVRINVWDASVNSVVRNQFTPSAVRFQRAECVSGFPWCDGFRDTTGFPVRAEYGRRVCVNRGDGRRSGVCFRETRQRSRSRNDCRRSGHRC